MTRGLFFDSRLLGGGCLLGRLEAQTTQAPSLLLCSADTFQNKLDSQRVCKLGGIVIHESPLSVREVLLQNGLGSLPVWVTETGRTAAISDSKKTTEQVTYYRRVLEEQLKRAWYQNTFFYEIVDDNSITDHWGMAVRDGASYPASYRTKPVWALVKKALTTPAFGGTGSECADGLDNDGDKLIDYPKDSDCSAAADAKESPDAVAPVSAPPDEEIVAGPDGPDIGTGWRPAGSHSSGNP